MTVARRLKLQFYLLDINHEMVNGASEVRLWGVNRNGERVLVCDRSFQPYFYLVIEKNASADKVLAAIESSRPSYPQISGLELLEMRYFGRPVNAVKVTCSNPEVLGKYSEELKKIEGVSIRLEDDIRPSTKYIIDNELTPCGWHEAQVKRLEGYPDIRIDETYSVLSKPKPQDVSGSPKLRLLAFSVIAHSEKGTPKAEKDPIIVISTATSDGEKAQYVAEPDGEKEILQRFLEFIDSHDPDIVTGFGCNTTDWPYLIQRASINNIKLTIDRTRTEPHTSVYGHISVTGRANVDLYDLAEDLLEVKVKNVENVAEYLGILKASDRHTIDDVEFSTYWDDPRKRSKLLEYSQQKAELTLAIAEAMYGYLSQLASLTGLPLDQVAGAAFGFRVDSHLMMRSHALRELIPKRTEQPYFPYRGAIVLEPKVGLHTDVVVLDLASMYPNLMMHYNVSPDTLVKPCTSVGEVYEIPEVGHSFRKEPPGFYKQILSSLIDERMKVKKQLAEAAGNSVSHRVLSAREKAIKVLTNAVYGYAGWIGARWYVREVAESAAALGRATIQKVIKMAKDEGLDVIYGDTDSVFVINRKDEVRMLLDRVETQLQMEIKADKFYTKILFTEAKKRYAGLLQDGSLDIVGLEVVRGDWSEAARIVQEKVIELVLREGGPDDAIREVKTTINNLHARRIPYDQLVIWKTLTKDVNKYEVNAPHVSAALTMIEAGYKVVAGDKVGYVIVKGEGKLFQKVKPYFMANYDQIDVDYYINNQIIPAALRILEHFEVDEQKLKGSAKQPSLADFTQP